MGRVKGNDKIGYNKRSKTCEIKTKNLSRPNCRDKHGKNRNKKTIRKQSV